MVLGTCDGRSTASDKRAALARAHRRTCCPGAGTTRGRPRRKELAATAGAGAAARRSASREGLATAPPDDDEDDLEPAGLGRASCRCTRRLRARRSPRPTCARPTAPGARSWPEAGPGAPGEPASTELPPAVAVVGHASRRAGRPARRARAGRRRRRRRGDRRRRLHRAVDGLLPGRGRPRRCGSSSSRRRSPGSARAGATAAGARRCSRPRWRELARGTAAARGARPCSRAMHDTVDEVGRVAAAEGIDCDWAKGGTVGAGPHRRCSSTGPGPRSPRRGRGASATRTAGCSTPSEARRARRRDRRARRRRTPRTAPRSTRPGWCAGLAARGRAARRARSTSGTRRPRSSRDAPVGAMRTPTGTSARGTSSGPPRRYTPTPARPPSATSCPSTR